MPLPAKQRFDSDHLRRIQETVVGGRVSAGRRHLEGFVASDNCFARANYFASEDKSTESAQPAKFYTNGCWGISPSKRCIRRSDAHLIRYAYCMSGGRFFVELSVAWSPFIQRYFLRAQPFFGRRESEPAGLRPGAVSNQSGPNNAVPPQASAAKQALDNAATQTEPSLAAPVKELGSTLTVGPNIKLKGVEITDCDPLVVEGTVEATMDSRVIQISERGAFKGSAEIDIAEIHGQFDGNLTVRHKLVIYATGKVIGKIRYGMLVIEEGGQLTGDIQFGTAAVVALASSCPIRPEVQRVA
jgi:cytoskeletal protein CcmA (bactofilin family)